MVDEVMRVYSTLITREARRTRSAASRLTLPRFLGCPDLPVAKREKKAGRLIVPNEGMHFNGVLVLSEFGRGRLDPENDLPSKPYCIPGRPLQRIHVTPVEYGSMVPYALKFIEMAGDWDDFLILPRTPSELPPKP